MTFNLEPCKRDGRGRNISDYAVRDHYEKIAEELFEAHEKAVFLDDICAFPPDFVIDEAEEEAVELLHVMTVCATRISTLGLSDARLAELQRAVIEHNRERGYFEEKTQ